MHNLFLIEKYSPSCSFWKNLITGNKIEGMSVEAVVNKYQGFEGNLLLYFPIKNPDQLLISEINKCFEIQKTKNCLLLHLLSDDATLPNSFKKQSSFMGYDIGICEDDETSVYSSIFNEILFGNIEELVSYKNYLNQNLIFQDKSLAQQYVNLHDELSKEGKDVEDYFKMTIYEVWKAISESAS